MGVTKNEMPIGEALHFLKHCPSFRQNYAYQHALLIHDKSNKVFIIYEFFFSFFFLKTNGKIHCKERHQRERADGLVKDKPNSTKAPKFPDRCYHSKVVDNTIQPSNHRVNGQQDKNPRLHLRALIVWILLYLLQHMLPFKLPIVNGPFPHDIPELDLMPPVVVEDDIVFMNSLIV